MIKEILILFIAVTNFWLCDAQSPATKLTGTYQRRIDTLRKNIYEYFYDSANALYYETNNVKPKEKPHSYLWPLCALIQAANEAETLQPSHNYITPVLNAVQKYYSTIPPVPAYQAYVTGEERDSRFYDDNQWIAIACLDAYNRTNNKKYLNIAEGIYRFMMTGFDTLSGGGLYWKEDEKKSKNTCSNGPGIIIALQLYKITNQQNYLDTALALYNWVNAHLQSPEGLYYDNIKIPSLKIDSAIYTYNIGTMLQSNVLLYNITKDKKYLSEAERIAQAAQIFFYKNNKLPGNYWFNAVLLRGEIALYKIDKNKDHIQFFIDDAERIWNDEKNEKGLVGKKDKRKTLIDQAAMMEIYARLAELNSN
ncbi:MAG: glycoside hydrolase family 76 protein [Bacteroidota bacterium]|nr:glycoside hydrolase family 76 protein [Bacteroidota bacterium]